MSKTQLLTITRSSTSLTDLARRVQAVKDARAMLPRCDWCSGPARWRVTYAGMRLPSHERAATCDRCSDRPSAILATLGLTCILASVAEEVR